MIRWPDDFVDATLEIFFFALFNTDFFFFFVWVTAAGKLIYSFEIKGFVLLGCDSWQLVKREKNIYIYLTFLTQSDL